jgi:hypothetical protein
MTTTPDTNPATLADRVAQLERGMASQLPDNALNAFRAEQADLQASGVPDGVAASGDAMPDVQPLDVHGAPRYPGAKDIPTGSVQLQPELIFRSRRAAIGLQTARRW